MARVREMRALRALGAFLTIASDIDGMGEEAARDLLFQRWMGLQITRKRLTDKAIGYEDAGGFELVTEAQRSAMERLEQVNRLVDDFLPGYISDVSTLKKDMGLHAEGKPLFYGARRASAYRRAHGVS